MQSLVANNKRTRQMLPRVWSMSFLWCLCFSDLGESLSFVTPYVDNQFEILPRNLCEPFYFSIPVGESIIAERFYHDCPIFIHHKNVVADLVQLDMVDFEVIVGMDWLHVFYASTDYRIWAVMFQIHNEPAIEQECSSAGPKVHFISYLKARKLFSKGCIYHLV